MKKLLSVALTIFVVLTSAAPITAAELGLTEPVKIPIVEVKVQDKTEADTLYAAGLDVLDVSFDGKDYTFTIMVKDFEWEYFAANNTKYVIVKEDATAKVDWLGYQKTTPEGPAISFAAPLPGLPGTSGSGQPG